MTKKKYSLLKKDFISVGDKKLYRIKSKVSIPEIGLSVGDLGGYIEGEHNLSHDYNAWVCGDAWVSGDARVYDNARVSGNARVYGNAQVFGNARVSGNAWVSGDARVCGDAWVSGDAWVYGNAQVCGNARVSGNARVYGNAWVSGDAWVYGVNITAVRSDGHTFSVVATPFGPRIIAGCRYFTFEEARKHWIDTRKDTQLGRESLALVDHLERMAEIVGLLNYAEGNVENEEP
jgi:hypothetical protein